VTAGVSPCDICSRTAAIWISFHKPFRTACLQHSLFFLKYLLEYSYSYLRSTRVLSTRTTCTVLQYQKPKICVCPCWTKVSGKHPPPNQIFFHFHTHPWQCRPSYSVSSQPKSITFSYHCSGIRAVKKKHNTHNRVLEYCTVLSTARVRQFQKSRQLLYWSTMNDEYDKIMIPVLYCVLRSASLMIGLASYEY
jgi:hypothetical protein